MTSSDILTRVRKVIMDVLKLENDTKIVPEADFLDDLGADSLDMVELVMGFEEEFGVEIPDSEAEKIRTVQATIDYINVQKASE